MIDEIFLIIVTYLKLISYYVESKTPGQYDKGLISILELLGDALDMIYAFEQEEARILKEEEKKAKMLAKVEELDDEQEDKDETDEKEDKENKEDKEDNGEGMEIVPYLKQKPKKDAEKKVFENLERIRKRKEEEKKKSKD